MKNEPEARADPRPDPPHQKYEIILKNPEGIESNTPIEVVGRTLKFLWATRVIRKETFPFFSFQLVPERQQSSPPLLQRVVSVSRPKGLLSGETHISETRDSSRELASNQVHLPSQSQISHEPKLDTGRGDQRSNREILLSVEWSLNSRDFAGSREPTESEILFHEKLRKEAWRIRIFLAQLPNEDFPIFTRLLAEVSENSNSLSWFSESRVSPLDLFPDPRENPDSNPNPIQVDLPDGPPGNQPGTPFQDEGERR